MKRADLIRLRDELGITELQELLWQKQHGGDRRSKKFQEIKKFQERKLAHLKIRRDELLTLIIDSSHSARTFQKLKKINNVGKHIEEAKGLLGQIDNGELSVDKAYQKALYIEWKAFRLSEQHENIKQEASK